MLKQFRMEDKISKIFFVLFFIREQRQLLLLMIKLLFLLRIKLLFLFLLVNLNGLINELNDIFLVLFLVIGWSEEVIELIKEIRVGDIC